ncbi:restriction endonuclease subunit S [Streptomyces virginiae]|uniref:restriction endonuclease subunit S n=1 Tax=Streptomyces virginiae TaxID=1961 RepID=UPI0038196AC0
MSEKKDQEPLPDGWVWTTLAEVLSEELINGRSVKTLEGGFPVLRLTALKSDGVDTAEQKEGAWSKEEALSYLIEEGDFLVSRGNGSRNLVGRGALVRSAPSPVAFPDTMIRIRVNPAVIQAQYLKHLWDSRCVRDQIEGAARTTAGIYKINQKILEGVRVPLPPLAQQIRIVDALEGHISRLDAASDMLARATLRARNLMPRMMGRKFSDKSYSRVRLDSIAEVRLGRQRSPKNHAGDQMRPYLRAANVGWSGLLLGDVKEMNFTDKETETYRLIPGDVLLSEASGSPGEVGKPALWLGEISECCFQNTLLRVRANRDVANPRYLHYFLWYEARRGAFRSGSRGVGIHHLGAAKLAEWQIPLPPLNVQDQIVDLLDGEVSRLQAATLAAEALIGRSSRPDALRRAILGRAFSGRLVSNEPDDEPASVLLARAAAERDEAAVKPARRRRTSQRVRSIAIQQESDV